MPDLIPGRLYKWAGASGSLWTRGSIYKAHTYNRIGTDKGNFKSLHDSPHLRHVLELVPEESVSRDTKKHDASYEFTVGSPDIIDLDAVPLTRENPVAIVQRSDGLHALVIHQSLYDKANAAGILDDLTEAMSPYYMDDEWIPYGSKVLSNALATIKKVRCAPFKNSKEIICKVKYPKV
jgi:hypothetical protein